ncbi:hypothetical protein J6590_052860 [Homalodisca vitripennis]|nr:hypothetical protein J6590_052860 [Homalodisca vitripennis]
MLDMGCYEISLGDTISISVSMSSASHAGHGMLRDISGRHYQYFSFNELDTSNIVDNR